MTKKKRRIKNGIVKDLHTPKYKMQVAKDKRKKSLIRYINDSISEFLKGFGK